MNSLVPSSPDVNQMEPLHKHNNVIQSSSISDVDFKNSTIKFSD